MADNLCGGAFYQDHMLKLLGRQYMLDLAEKKSLVSNHQIFEDLLKKKVGLEVDYQHAGTKFSQFIMAKGH